MTEELDPRPAELDDELTLVGPIGVAVAMTAAGVDVPTGDAPVPGEEPLHDTRRKIPIPAPTMELADSRVTVLLSSAISLLSLGNGVRQVA